MGITLFPKWKGIVLFTISNILYIFHIYFLFFQIVLISTQNLVVHGFIPAGRANHYPPSLVEGSIVKVDRFDDARCTYMYKITDQPLVIRFIPHTTTDEVITVTPVINLPKFMLRKFNHLQALANTNLNPWYFFIYFCKLILHHHLFILAYESTSSLSSFRCCWSNSLCARVWP